MLERIIISGQVGLLAALYEDGAELFRPDGQPTGKVSLNDMRRIFGRANDVIERSPGDMSDAIRLLQLERGKDRAVRSMLMALDDGETDEIAALAIERLDTHTRDERVLVHLENQFCSAPLPAEASLNRFARMVADRPSIAHTWDLIERSQALITLHRTAFNDAAAKVAKTPAEVASHLEVAIGEGVFRQLVSEAEGRPASDVLLEVLTALPGDLVAEWSACLRAEQPASNTKAASAIVRSKQSHNLRLASSVALTRITGAPGGGAAPLGGQSQSPDRPLPSLLHTGREARIRIVDVNEYYSPTVGGMRNYVDRKMSILADLGYDLTVIAPWHEDRIEEKPGGGRVYWAKGWQLIGDRNYHLFRANKRIPKLLDMLQPDVIETSSPFLPAHAVGNWPGDAIKVYLAHSDMLGSYPQRWLEGIADTEQVERLFAWYTRYMGRFLERFNAFVVNGPELARRYSRRGLRVDAVIPMGIENRLLSPDLRDERLRVALLAQCGLPAEGHLMIGIGRLYAEKRWPMVIKAAQMAGADLPVGLILIGDGIDRPKIEKCVGASPHIRLFRPVYDREKLSRILASCDALIHGSETEPFGMVAYEALASGLPLIVPDEGGCAEIADPLFAETYHARDPTSAAAAIRRLFMREPAILRAAARRAATRVRTDRDHAVELVSYYQSLLDARRGMAWQNLAQKLA